MQSAIPGHRRRDPRFHRGPLDSGHPYAALGLRESRRIWGQVTLTAEDAMQQREWDDAVCYGSFYIDIHNPAGPGMGDQSWYPPRGFRCQIPYRALVPERIDNLLVAGRCTSADHVALGSTRIMSTCMALGQAAGAAVFLSLHEEVPPRKLDPQILRAELRKQATAVDEAGIRALNDQGRRQQVR